MRKAVGGIGTTMKLIALGAVIGTIALGPGSAVAQNANPYGGAAGFLYSQGRVAAPGQVGIPGPASAPETPALEPARPSDGGAATPRKSMHGPRSRRARDLRPRR